MRAISICTCLILLLTGCVGGLRTVMISNFSLNPPPPGIRDYPKYYVGLNSSSATLDDALLLQLYSGNFQDMADKEPVDAPYYISGHVSSKIDGVSIDLSSFTIDNLMGTVPLHPKVSLTQKRANIKVLAGDTRVCSYSENSHITGIPAIGVAAVPKYDGAEWPPKDIDNSILCILLNFKISARTVSPTKRFQLHFRYFVGGVAKEATLYFYPIKYRYFQS